jgi:hypothetical protein
MVYAMLRRRFSDGDYGALSVRRSPLRAASRNEAFDVPIDTPGPNFG